MGRNALLLVIGFSALMLMTGINLSGVSVEAFKNAMDYYDTTLRYNIANAGANFACTQIFQNSNWRTGYTNVALAGGSFTVTATTLGSTSQVKVVSTANYQGSTYSISVLMQPSSFAKFGFWGGTHASAAQWETGDTVWGPMHTQGTLKTFGSPVFEGKVTNLSGLTMSGSPKDPKFYGGYQTGVSVPMPTTALNQVDSAATAGGKKQTSGTLYLNFQSDGTVKWKTSAAGVETTTPLSTFAPNGVICIDKGDLYVQGTVHGNISICADVSSGSTGGHVYIQNDLVYASDPKTNPNSTDMLGILSKNDIQVQDNGSTTFNIQASMFSQNGGMSVQDGTSRPAGMLNVTGGLIAEYLYPTSNGASGSARKGYNLALRYDSRFLLTAPPFYPKTSMYEILSWYE